MQIHPIAVETLGQMRTRQPSDSHVAVDADGFEPVRCCLRDARAGERLLLTSYRPPMPPSPYTEVGAVFIHADPADCTPLLQDFPDMSTRRQQVLRAYDDRGWIHDFVMADPGQSVEQVQRLLADPDVAFVDVRNPGPGCYMFRVTRTV